ncbi:MAG: alpha/beta hydrolase [Clostridiales bacterium]|nr:alpha/beta hydrolase [Clostridiales bacterium]
MKLWSQTPPLFDPAYEQPETELHFYPANTASPAGCVIICPGGAYRLRAAHEGEAYAHMFNQAGLHAAVLDYRLYPYSYPAPMLDLQRAIRFVRYHAEEWNILPDKIAICGSSAGGHLAAVCAVDFDDGMPDGDDIDRVSCRPDAAILCYAVATLGPFTHQDTSLVITKGDPMLVEKLSAEKNIAENTPPMFIWHTADDQAVPVENALLMGMALSEKKVPYELHIFPHGPHGLGLAAGYPEVAKWAELCQSYLKSLGF